MGGKDSNFKVVYRGEQLENYQAGGWVFFQRSKQCGGGFWLGRTYDDCFWLELERPTSLSAGIHYLMELDSIRARGFEFDGDSHLF
ncbi:hypothetical protein [Pantoea sp. BAV 3049]|uniref:hypothetical protein n=1 Tax=Pantoea sp. BAV 3049 TaxID=2654188 RepID=UPI00131DC6BF|nr:hypothetical protein [Pantoea sp. BAV 3049]